MKFALVTSVLATLLYSILTASALAEDWKIDKKTSSLTIYSRPHAGSKLKEFKAIGEIDAPSRTVSKLIDDVEAYPNFMPYTSEAKVLRRDRDSIITYQRLTPKIVGDRDYTLRIEKKSSPTVFGVSYLHEWRAANDQGPPEKSGVFRVKVVNGSWLLEPIASNKTRATYRVFSDSGISVPGFLANAISETGITKLFAAVRKQASNPKYREN